MFSAYYVWALLTYIWSLQEPYEAGIFMPILHKETEIRKIHKIVQDHTANK